MIPIYQAAAFHKVIEKGASTRPWLVSVWVGETQEPYVLKLYKYSGHKDYRPINKEVFASVLAQEFDLRTPSFALIDMGIDFQKTLPDNLRNRLNLEIDHRLKFGTKYLEGTQTFTIASHTKHLEVFEMETIYAFDLLIRNVDRRMGKPNILYKDRACFLIDHELTLSLGGNFIEKIQKSDFSYIKKMGEGRTRHIFQKILRRWNNRVPCNFETFEEYLRMLKPEVITPFADFLVKHEFDVDDYLQILRYLHLVKENQAGFISALKQSISS